MNARKSTFAVMFGNRGFFPAHLQSTARQEVLQRLKDSGHDALIMPQDSTSHGAIETFREGRLFADFLRCNKGKYDGVVLSLPNFGDELGAAAALKDADVPVFIQAYPDDMERLAPAHRRDAFCGKFALCNTLYQNGVRYTVSSPHVVQPSEKAFVDSLDFFDRICRVVTGLRDARIVSIGARTTPFNSVRSDELTLQKHRISVITEDMASIIGRVNDLDSQSRSVTQVAEHLRDLMDFSDMPKDNFVNLCRLSVILNELIQEHEASALAIRCWIELQQQLGVSPCFLNAVLCERGIPVACEVDISNAVMMLALQYASGNPATILDWNNNYEDHDNKCILFHCGNVPPSMLQGKEKIIEHAILAETAGKGCSWGCNCGRFKPMSMTFGSLTTEDGQIRTYIGQGRITQDKIPSDFFGCAGVAEIDGLQSLLQGICQNGYRHHVSLSEGHVMNPIVEAFTRYLDFEVQEL